MRDCSSILAGAISSIPLSDQNQRLVCGLPFTIPATQIAPDLKLVLNRARVVIGEIRKIIGDVDQGNASPTLKAAADGIGDTLDDPITTLLDALPT
jgi:hypothetical protein